jgi:hypothetical protein
MISYSASNLCSLTTNPLHSAKLFPFSFQIVLILYKNSESVNSLTNNAMKTLLYKVTFIACLFSFQHSNNVFCQSQIQGNWNGKFMNDFKTIVEISLDENNNLSGTIKMFIGPDLIQDDLISNISISQNILKFRIDAKDTEFRGELNGDFSEITGAFIFPDKSEHPLKLVKSDANDLYAGSSTESFRELKDKKYSTNELKEDFDFFVAKLKELHPQLYSYTSAEHFKNMADEIQISINRGLSINEYFNLISPLVESVKCSHTGIRLPLNYLEAINTHDNFLPLKLLFVGSKVFCLKNYNNSDNSVNPGDEIVSINGKSIQDVIEILFRFIPSEGDNVTTKNYRLNQNFNSYFNLIDNSDQFEIEFINADTRMKSTIKACKFVAFEEQNKDVTNAMPVEFNTYKQNNIGILTIKSFMIGDINSYIQKMDDIFETLQTENRKQLVIDLRGNPGGHPIFAAQLLSYLTNEDFTYFKRNSDITEFEPLYNKMHPNNLQFNGDIFVFVDGGCLSTTGHLISLLKYHTHAIFVGQEPGSTFRCNDFSVKETLPITKIEVNIPRVTFETAVPDSFKSIPFSVDYPVNISIKDCLAGIDSYLKFMDNLILKP